MRFGSFSPPGRHRRLGVLDGDRVLDLSELAVERPLPWPELLLEPNLDPLLAASAPAWREVHGWLTELLAAPSALDTHDIAPLRCHTP